MSASTRIRFVLVGTQHPGNIGAAARAMKTMGLSRLVLVAPEQPLDEVAFRRSAGAEDVLGDAPVFATLAEAVADCRLVLGCTARARRVQLEELLPEVAGQRAVARAAEPAEVAFVFGRERTGLSNDELQLCHAAVHIPSDPEFSSLNLAAAVQVLAYEVRMAQLEGQAAPPPEPGYGEAPASHAQLEGLFGQFGDTLDQIDFHKGRAPESAMRKLRRLFMKADLSEQEVRLLRGILSDAQRMARLANERQN
ncbi:MULTISPECIES: RNA methyltransferase [Stenotrophomonas]|uniref:tRNA (cytidine/uridine-2'-O-)-methyltransferase TrmJ n=1 Tax=Stenotrophomonas acidaminiphila TaxID=128780 RepID=A0A0R0E1A5_9GAMM|nr:MULTISPECIES: RNA methyltransferase [Stenotrophomonas]ALJ27967.1 SpoU family tRNA/rRNA methyltransferase [Stenotrophomonas acidaminiphila]KRG84327.1 RNA methyltransferase [Stenotrophomonas acidaminiphila]MCA7024563.1 RNA methyltransferase [Stenotrophomonas acidaminiphila]MCE4073870.1 RNA methyltransferase [Stenotrophomonas acidaminiphila]QOG00146.1 RNA methyltransferase [Stenotrophomonas sp. CW117]